MEKSDLKPGHIRRIKSLALLSNEQLASFLNHVELVRCPRSQAVFEEGQRGDAMFLILEGRMRVCTKRRGGQMLFLRMLEAGESFGEIALLGQSQRSATVESADDSLLLKISASSLETLMVEQPALAAQFLYHLARSLGSNLRDLTKRLRAGAELSDVLAYLK